MIFARAPVSRTRCSARALLRRAGTHRAAFRASTNGPRLCSAPLARCAASGARERAQSMIRFEFQTADTSSHSRDASRPRFAIAVALLNEEGAGKTGCPLHPRSRVQIAQKKRTRAYRYSRRHPAFPAQWFDGLCRDLPGETSSVATVALRIADATDPVGSPHHRKTWRQLRAPGPRAFAVRGHHRSSRAA